MNCYYIGIIYFIFFILGMGGGLIWFYIFRYFVDILYIIRERFVVFYYGDVWLFDWFIYNGCGF